MDGDADIDAEGPADAAFLSYEKMLKIGTRIKDKKLTEVRAHNGEMSWDWQWARGMCEFAGGGY